MNDVICIFLNCIISLNIISAFANVARTLSLRFIQLLNSITALVAKKGIFRQFFTTFRTTFHIL